MKAILQDLHTNERPRSTASGHKIIIYLFKSRCFPPFSPGACEGTLSCSTCHLIVDKDWYEKIPDFLTEEEQDMLDLAFGLTDT